MWYDEKKRKAGESHAKRSADRPPADHGGDPRDARAGCAREKKKRLKKTLITIAVTLLVITLLAALALFVRAKLQTLDKPLDAKTNQTAQTQPQEPSIEPEPQEPAQPEPNVPEAEPEADTLPESETEPALDAHEEPESEESRTRGVQRKDVCACRSNGKHKNTRSGALQRKRACSLIWSRTPSWSRKTPTRASHPASMTKVIDPFCGRAGHRENWDETFTMTQSIIDPLFFWRTRASAGFVPWGSGLRRRKLLTARFSPPAQRRRKRSPSSRRARRKTFAALMNEKAQALGLKDTHFVPTPAACTTRTTTQRSPIWRSSCRPRSSNPHCREVLTSVNHTSPSDRAEPRGRCDERTAFCTALPPQTEPETSSVQAAKPRLHGAGGHELLCELRHYGKWPRRSHLRHGARLDRPLSASPTISRSTGTYCGT